MKKSLSLFAFVFFGFAAVARADVTFDGYWTELRPPWRQSHTLTYDPVGQRMILFGGSHNGQTFRGETWSLELGATPAWDPSPDLGPRPRDRHTAVYDSARQRLLIYGGRVPDDPGPIIPMSDTWAYDLAGGSGWTELQTTGGDPAPERQLMSAICDAVNDRMLVVFGTDGFALYNTVWALDLSGTPAWHLLAVAGTPPHERRSNAALYDPVRHRLITFGGYANNVRYNDVWTVGLDGAPVWTQLLPTGTPPSPRESPAVAYDSVHDRMLVFGGSSPTNFNDVWALSLGDSPAWTQLTPSGTPPSPRAGNIAAYDPIRDELVIHGGGTDIRNETWRLALSADPPIWTQESPWGATYPPRKWHSAVYDGGRHQVVLYGGVISQTTTALGDAWALSLSGFPSWHALAPLGSPPPARMLTSAIYDPVGERMIIYGGLNTTELLDVWSLSLAGTPTWSQVPYVNFPPLSEGHSAIYDSGRRRMVAFGGGLGSDTWALSLEGSPTWTKMLPAGSPPPTRTRHTAIYDPTRDRMLVFGGYNSSRFNDVWELSFTGTPTWTQLFPSGTLPPTEEGQGALYDGSRDRMLVMGYGAGEVWELSLAAPMTWRKLDPGGTGIPGNRSYEPIIYDPVDDQLVLTGGYIGVDYGDTWLLGFTPTVSVDPTPRSSTLSLAPLGSNPARGDLAVSYSLPVAAPASLDVFDVRGRQVLGVDAPSSAGGHRLVVAPAGSLIEGVYWLRLTQGWASAVQRVVVLH